MPRSRREHLVETALTLFEQHGFHATGIDRILTEAGVAKMTLYHHFRSKDELILAALRRRDEKHRNALMRDVVRATDVPRDRLVAVFDVLDRKVQSDDFRGCTFHHAAAEFSGPEEPAKAVAAEHKRLLVAWLQELAADAEAGDPAVLARQLALLIEGALSCAHVSDNRNAMTEARGAAAILIAHHCA